MRILVLTNLLPPVSEGGYEKRCGRVVRHLRSRHDVRVLTTDRHAERHAGDAAVVPVLPWMTPTRADAWRTPGQSHQAAKATRRVLTAFRPELVYIWNITNVPQSALAVILQSRVPVALNIGEYWLERLYGDGEPFMRRLLEPTHGVRKVAKAALKAYNSVDPALRLRPEEGRPVGISWITEHLRRATTVPTYVAPLVEEVTLPFSPHADAFAGIERRTAEPPTFLFAGRVTEDKGVDVAIRALAKLVEERPAARLLVAGTATDEMRSSLTALAGSLGLEPQAVTFLGNLEAHDLRERIATCRAMLVPSVWDEPGGLVCLDSAVAGIPLVAAAVGGIPELVRDEEHALLFPRSDAARCAQLMLRVLDEPDATAAMVERARRRAAELSEDRYLAADDDFRERVVAAYAEAVGR
ncbi:MAG TPA: glycosyltransferase family 4 protein [Baekduia sp.]